MRDRRHELRIQSWPAGDLGIPRAGSEEPVEPGWSATLHGPMDAWFLGPELRGPFPLLAGVRVPTGSARIQFDSDPVSITLHQQLRDEMIFVDESRTPPRRRPPEGRTLADGVIEELRFISKHRRQFHPGLSFVPPTEPLPTPAPDAARPEGVGTTRGTLLALAALGASGGPTADDALRLLQQARGTTDELFAVRCALLARRRHGPLPARVRDECADILAALGDRAGALVVLEDREPPPALLPLELGLEVDAPVGEANATESAAAAERILAQDLSAPGVRERHRRFRALANAARLTVDAFRALSGRPKRDELHATARELEATGELARAAQAYALAGERAEQARLAVPPGAPTPMRAPRLDEVRALDRQGRRLDAIAAARRILGAEDALETAILAREIAARLVRGPLVELEVDDALYRYAFGDEVTIGRVGATIVIASPAVSRQHLRLRRAGGAPVVEDLGSHNGTWLAGARLSGAIPVGAGLDLSISNQIPCSIRPIAIEPAGGVTLFVIDERWVLPLGEARLRGATLAAVTRGEDSIVELRLAAGRAVLLGDVASASTIELCAGDRVRLAATPDEPEMTLTVRA